MTVKIQWSYSGLKDYKNCPRQYQQVKVLKNFTKKQTQQMLYGTEVHKALEDYVKDGTPLLKNYQRYKKQLDPLREMTGTKYPEHEMALTTIDGEQGFIVDYKTGSNRYPDPKQLQLMALMGFKHFPEVKHFKAGLLFVAHEHFVTSEYNRDDEEKLWRDFWFDLERLRLSHENDSWQANPTALCGWCPVQACEFYKEK